MFVATQGGIQEHEGGEAGTPAMHDFQYERDALVDNERNAAPSKLWDGVRTFNLSRTASAQY